MGGLPKIGGKPPKWMVKIRETPIKMDDLGGGPPLFLETPILLPNKKSLEKRLIISSYQLSHEFIPDKHSTDLT